MRVKKKAPTSTYKLKFITKLITLRARECNLSPRTLCYQKHTCEKRARLRFLLGGDEIQVLNPRLRGKA